MPLTRLQAHVEAERCLACYDAPCRAACPTHIDVPTFIGMIRSGNVRGAAKTVRSANALANVCGKVCPEEVLCQASCTRARIDAPVLIRELHFFATQTEARAGFSPHRPFGSSAGTAAVIGGGPSGLGCAFELAKLGLRVTLFDPRGLGGVPRHSIPAFRLTSDELRDDIAFLSGAFTVVKERVDHARLSALREEFDAVYVAVGLGLDRPLGLPGETLPGVHPVLPFLESAKRGETTLRGRVVVIGGGNVSLDAAATARKIGASEVTLLYRRSEAEMKVWKSELEEARKLGVSIRFLTLPVGIVGDGVARGVLCRRTALSAERDRSGRPVPVEVSGSEFTLEAEHVIVAVGQVIGAEIARAFSRSQGGLIAVDGESRTSLPGVFAGGDATDGEGTIVASVGRGKAAAHAMFRHVQGARNGGAATSAHAR